MAGAASHPFDTPGLGLLALNGAGITALTAFWEALPHGYRAEFSWAFLFFALGVVLSVLSVYYQYLADRDLVRRPRSVEPFEPGESRMKPEDELLGIAFWIFLFLVAGILATMLLGSPIPLRFGLFAAVLLLVAAPPLLWNRVQVGQLSTGAGVGGMLFFLIGILLTVGAWGVAKTADPDRAPLARGSAGSATEIHVNFAPPARPPGNPPPDPGPPPDPPPPTNCACDC